MLWGANCYKRYLADVNLALGKEMDENVDFGWCDKFVCLFAWPGYLLSTEDIFKYWAYIEGSWGI